MSQFTHDVLVIEQNYLQAQDIKAKIDVLTGAAITYNCK